MDYGDIVRLNISNGMVSVQKVDIIEIGGQSPEAVEAYVRAAFKTMPDDTRLSLISDLTALLQQKRRANGWKENLYLPPKTVRQQAQTAVFRGKLSY